MNKKIAVLAGDGIGSEVMQAALLVLKTIEKLFGHHFTFLEGKIGGQAFEDYQNHCPEETLKICEQSDAILFGSVGGPVQDQHQAKWKNCEANSILKLRKYFNLNINIRPMTVFPELSHLCPLKPEFRKEGIDFTIFRELTGGIYFGLHERNTIDGKRIARDECVYDENQIKKIAHAAFQAAQYRRKRLCSVDKANVLATSRLWREIIEEVSKEYTDVTLQHMLVDNCAMQMVLNPHQFDVILTENMFGDILSDLAATLPGSLGLIPSASLNDQGFGLYEPSGGSAPDIAGKNIANPCAQILSAAMMLRYSFGMHEEARCIEKAVQKTIAQGVVTRDLASFSEKAVSTVGFVEVVVNFLTM